MPPETVIYCAHEYSEANARFAISVDDAPAVAARAGVIAARRREGLATVPTTIAQELATNPFLRLPARQPERAPEVFADVRVAKDGFKG